MESSKNIDGIDGFVKAVNNNAKLKNDLDEAVQKALPEKYFDNLEAFVSFLPNTIKDFFSNKENFSKLGEEWENFEIKNIQGEDLEKLYKINLEPKTKTAIIKKFNISNKTGQRLSSEEDIKKALSTFKKISGKNEVSVRVFNKFIYNNFSTDALSSADLDDIVDYVKSTGKNDKFTKWNFWNMCSKFKSISSKKFMDFIVENTGFTELDDNQLICSIIVLVEKHPKYQEGKNKDNKDNMGEALKDILCGNGPYEKFSEALAKVKDIKTKIKLDEIVENIQNSYVRDFVADLISNKIEIKIEENKFAVNDAKEYTNDELIKFLETDPELNNWLTAIFSASEGNFDKINFVDNENKGKAKENLIILDKNGTQKGKVKTLDELVQKMSKSAVIKNFIEKSKVSNSSRKIYDCLSDADLNKVVLP